MSQIVCEPAATSGWEIASALGTIAAAVFTAGAFVTAFVIAGRDRRAADAAMRRQIQAADDRQARELVAASAARLREHEVDLLLQLQNQMARYAAYGNMPQQNEASQLGRGILLALRDASQLPATREVFAPSEPAFSELPRFGNGQADGNRRTNEALRRAPREIAEEIRRVAQS